jgi:hypothetical protein
MAAFLSGEMKDTVQMNPAGAYGLPFLYETAFVLLTIAIQSLNGFSLATSGKSCSAVGREVLACGSRCETLNFLCAHNSLSIRVEIPSGEI